MDQLLQHQNFMREAIRLSILNVKHEQGGPFAAIVVKEGEIIANGTNQVTASNDPTAHAEVVAIRNACKILGTYQLSGCELFTTCEPCPMCLGAIYWARPSCVYYGNTQSDAAAIGFDDHFIYQEIALPPEARSIPQQQLLPTEAIEAFRLWDQSAQKKGY